MTDSGTVNIRSYRGVFRLERRIYRVDRFVIPVPGGIPLRGLVYFAITLIAVLLLSALPLLRSLAPLAPMPIRLLLLPAALAIIATQATPDGRPAHHFAATWIAWRSRAHRTFNGRRILAAGQQLLVDHILESAC